MKKKVIKSTKYCDLLLQARLNDSEYTYCIERIYVKAKKTEEIRFSLYKDTVKSDNRYIPRSLDVTELELIELIKEKTKLRERLKKQANLITQIEALQYKS